MTDIHSCSYYCDRPECIKAQRDELREVGPKQEPVAWITPDGEGFRIRFSPPINEVLLGWDALYTIPPKRPWVGLTDAEIDLALKSCNTLDTYKYFRAIEAKLKEKNHELRHD